MTAFLRSAAAAAAAAALAFSTLGVVGAEWPSKPVRIVVPFAAGGAADTMGRIFAGPLSAALGQQFVIETRPGGGGIPATEAVARSEPDGYTLMTSGISFHVIAPAMNKNAGFDPIRDFTHIAHFGGTPLVLAVHPSLGIRNFREFAIWAGSRKEGIQYVSAGFGSVANMVAESFAAKAGFEFRHVPYKGGGSAIFDLVAGHVKVGCLTLSTTIEHLRSAGLVPIAFTTATRLPDFPQVPTFEELGYADLVVTSWLGLSGPADLARDIVDRLNREVNASMALPQVRASLDKQSIVTKSMSPEEFTTFVRSEVGKWSAVINSLGKVK
jgi:tripartite-type tricarboxylate transporter receptor subunit TctC